MTPNDIHANQTTSFYVYKPIARVDVDDIAFSSSLFGDKVDNTDGLNQLQMDAFGILDAWFTAHFWLICTQ